MALIKCPECKADISDTAEACPKCGYSHLHQNIKPGSVERSAGENKKSNYGCLIAAIIIIGIGILFGIFIFVGLAENIRRENAIYGK